MKEKIIDDMREILEQYYEAAGFKDVKSNKLKLMNQSELEKLYKSTFIKKLNDSDIPL